MENKLQVFEKNGWTVRTIENDGEPWFVASDVCKVLEIQNPTDALSRLDDDERARFNLGRQGEANIISEAGLYSLVLGSRKPEAKEFKRWVTHEVLPSIRKHGVYATQDFVDKSLSDPDYMIAVLTRFKEEREKRIEAERKNAILMHVNKTYTMTEIAKECGLRSATELNKKLHEMKIQYKQNDTWLAYADYASQGYFDIKQEVLDSGRVIYHRRVTQDGRAFILNLFNVKNFFDFKQK